MPHTCRFQTYFTFIEISATSFHFSSVRPTPLNSGLIFNKAGQIFVVLIFYFAAVHQTGTAKLAPIFQTFKKTLSALSVNEINVTSRKAFIDHLFALENEKESKYDQRTLWRLPAESWYLF